MLQQKSLVDLLEAFSQPSATADTSTQDQKLNAFIASSVQLLQNKPYTTRALLKSEDQSIRTVANTLSQFSTVELQRMLKKTRILESHNNKQVCDAKNEMNLHIKEQEKIINNRKSIIQNNYKTPKNICKVWQFNDKLKSGVMNLISKSDLDTLRPCFDLNGSIINFYIGLLLEKIVKSSTFTITHYFNTYFFSKLVNQTGGSSLFKDKNHNVSQQTVKQRVRQNYSSVRNWTKNTNIFQKYYLIFPINIGHHWAVIIVYNLPLLILKAECIAKPVILYLDSMKKKSKLVLVAIRQYLQMEFDAKFREQYNEQIRIDQITLPDYQLLVPRQTNLNDCGVYMLANIEAIFLQPQLLRIDFSKPSNRDFLRLFPQIIALSFRYRLMNLLVEVKECGEECKSVIDGYLQQRSQMMSRESSQGYESLDQSRFQRFLWCNNCKVEGQEEMIQRISFYYQKDHNYYSLS